MHGRSRFKLSYNTSVLQGKAREKGPPCYSSITALKNWNIKEHRRQVSLCSLSWTCINSKLLFSFLLLSFSCSFLTQPTLLIHRHNPGLLHTLAALQGFLLFSCLPLELFCSCSLFLSPMVGCLLQELTS